VYPVVLALHLSAISLFGAMIVATDLRLLGWLCRKRAIADVIQRLRTAKRIGFILAASCGFSSSQPRARKYLLQPILSNQRCSCLLWSRFMRWSFDKACMQIRRVYTLTGEPPRQAKLAASLSLLLWLAILCAGRAIGYVAAGREMHSQIASRTSEAFLFAAFSSVNVRSGGPASWTASPGVWLCALRPRCLRQHAFQ